MLCANIPTLLSSIILLPACLRKSSVQKKNLLLSKHDEVIFSGHATLSVRFEFGKVAAGLQIFAEGRYHHQKGIRPSQPQPPPQPFPDSILCQEMKGSQR